MTVATKTLQPMKAQAETHVLPLDMLCRSAHNVRTRSTDEADEIPALAELIFSFGLINPLSIVDHTQNDDFRFPVAAGDRRYRALCLLAEQGRIRSDEPVDVRRFSDADALGLSLAENSGRLEMHAVDQFEAFRKLIETEGKSLEAVAESFGVSVLTVRRRLTLSKIAPALLDLYRKGSIAQDQLQVLALCEDHATQVHIWEGAPSWERTAYALRSVVLAAEVSANDNRARYVGLDAYKAAGGAIRSDLFSDDDTTYLTDVALLDRLYAEKLETARASIAAEGWAWVEPTAEIHSLYKFHRVRPTLRAMTESEAAAVADLDAKIETLEQKLQAISDEGDASDDADGSLYAQQEAAEEAVDELNAQRNAIDAARTEYPAEARPQCGVLIAVDKGILRIEAGLMRHADYLAQQRSAAQAKTAGSDDQDGQDDHDDDAASPNAMSVEVSPYAASTGRSGMQSKDKPEYSEKVITDLSAHRTGALMAAMLDNQRVALATLALSLLDSSERGHGLQTPATINASGRASTLLQKASGFATSRAGRAIEEAEAHNMRLLGFGIQPEGDDAAEAEPSTGIYARLLALELPQLVELLTYLTARTLDVIGPRKTAGTDDELAAALNLDMADYWEAGSDNFFVHVPKAKAVQALEEAGAKTESAQVLKLKKTEAAALAQKAVAGKRWLPVPLRAAA